MNVSSATRRLFDINSLLITMTTVVNVTNMMYCDYIWHCIYSICFYMYLSGLGQLINLIVNFYKLTVKLIK